ncbi:MAG: SGNH/GDSL hydrolase family protein [Lachnospiraceae bacterium]|nr:SGNH/GDSL hydrolase family protein [Lachnospiraceae bacterium]
MKKRMAHVLGGSIFLLLVLGIGWIANGVLNTNVRSYVTTDTPDADGCQVLFFGTSQGANDLNPVTVWDTAGIMSYNFCAAGQYIGTTYYVMQDVLNRQSPKAVVLDFESLTRPDDFLTISNKLSSLPMIADPRLRFEMYRDVIHDSPAWFLPFFRYHNRWKEITRNDARREYDVMGCMGRTEVQAETGLFAGFEQEPKAIAVREREMQYLEQILALCKEKGCGLFLVNLPAYDTEEAGGQNRWIREWAAGQGIPYCDANTPEAYEAMGLLAADFADGHHLNIRGQEKVSAFLGQWLSDEAGLADMRKAQAEAFAFEERLARYRSVHTDRKIMMAESFEEVVSLLAEGSYTAAFSLDGVYMRYEGEIWPALKKAGVTRTMFERGGGFVRGQTGEWLFDSMGAESCLWSLVLYDDDLVLRGHTEYDGEGNGVLRIELIMDRSDQSKVKDGVNVLVYSHSQRTFLKCVGIGLSGE